MEDGGRNSTWKSFILSFSFFFNALRPKFTFLSVKNFFIYIEQVIYAIHATTNLCPNSSYRRLTHKLAKDLEKVINSKPIWICFFISQCYGKQQLASAWQYSVEPDHSRCFTYAQQIHEDLTWSLTSLIDLRSCPSHTLASFCSQDSANRKGEWAVTSIMRITYWRSGCLYISVHLFQLHFYVACDLPYFINVLLHAAFDRWKAWYLDKCFRLSVRSLC